MTTEERLTKVIELLTALKEGKKLIYTRFGDFNNPEMCNIGMENRGTETSLDGRICMPS